MKKIARILAVAGLLLLSGCSSEMAKRSAYESMRSKAEMDCRQHPGSACQDSKSYDEYQRSLDRRSEPGK
ncbi:MAG: hypothetical protein A2X58_09065 [Nitrospirae bacterium GWC2_56_14]|nr:MAG: hypothetical protein A2X58_09065 [Nitrospirae bacterium GWC2_56_14]